MNFIINSVSLSFFFAGRAISVMALFDATLPGCMTDGPLPVFIYDPVLPHRSQETNPFVVHLAQWLRNPLFQRDDGRTRSAVAVVEKDDACLFLPMHPASVLCNASRMDCGFYEMAMEYPFEKTLQHWRGGQNHLFYMTWHTDWSIPSFPIGDAILMRSSATRATYRRGMDVQMPFYSVKCNATRGVTCRHEEQVPGRGARFAPDWVFEAAAGTPEYTRDLLLTFVGAIRVSAPYAVPAADLTIGNRLRVALTCLHDRARGVIVADREDPTIDIGDPMMWPNDIQSGNISTWPDYDRRLAFEEDKAQYHPQTMRRSRENVARWKEFYWGTHLRSRYVLCPGGAGAHSQRLNEALAAGAVPVVFHADDIEVLPFEDHAEAAQLWARCAVKVGRVDDTDNSGRRTVIGSLVDRLEAHLRGDLAFEGDVEVGGTRRPDWRWLGRRDACKELHDTHFATHDLVLDSAFRQIQSALQWRRQRIEKQKRDGGLNRSTILPQRVLARDLPDFNGAWPGENTPFPARDRMAALAFGRKPLVRATVKRLPGCKAPSSSSVHQLAGGVDSGGTTHLIGAYESGLACLMQRIQASLHLLSLGTTSGAHQSNRASIRFHLQKRLLLTAAALGEESAYLGKRLNVAAAAYGDCCLAYHALITASVPGDGGSPITDRDDALPPWAKVLCAWCEYVAGLLAQRRAEEKEKDIAAATAAAEETQSALSLTYERERTDETWGERERAGSTMAAVEASFRLLLKQEAEESRGIELSSAAGHFAAALRLAPAEASGWAQLRGGKLINDMIAFPGTFDKEDNGSIESTAEKDSKYEGAGSDRLVVDLQLDPVSWLAWEFEVDVERVCPASICRISVASEGEDGEQRATNSNDKKVSGAPTAFFTSFGGRPDHLPVDLPSHRFNAVIFMENDSRLYPGISGDEQRRAFAKDLQANWWPQVDLVLGYRTKPIWLEQDKQDQEGEEASESPPLLLSPRPWHQISYINDPIEHFQKWPSFGDAHNSPLPLNDIPGVAFFSSQCDPLLAWARLELVGALIPELLSRGVRFSSFGKCWHNDDIATAAPGCSRSSGGGLHDERLRRTSVDHDGEKSCVLSRFKFYLAIENSEDEGYVTEKLMQGLLAGSVPIYWGAPNVAELLPHPNAIVDVRSFDGRLDLLAEYIATALREEDTYQKHLAWKSASPGSWQEGFHHLASIPKTSAFCAVCDYAAKEQQQQDERFLKLQSNKSEAYFIPR